MIEKTFNGCQCERCSLWRELTAYQIAKDNLSLSLLDSESPITKRQLSDSFDPLKWQVY